MNEINNTVSLDEYLLDCLFGVESRFDDCLTPLSTIFQSLSLGSILLVMETEYKEDIIVLLRIKGILSITILIFSYPK